MEILLGETKFYLRKYEISKTGRMFGLNRNLNMQVREFKNINCDHLEKYHYFPGFFLKGFESKLHFNYFSRHMILFPN